MDLLETRELVYFVTLAEELHFSRAAERLGISQPPLSRAISRMERRLGAQLLRRTSRRVELTEAGEALLLDCRRVLEVLDGTADRVRRAARPGRLVLAMRPGTASGLLVELVRLPGAAHCEVIFTHDRVGALHFGKADVALLCSDTDDTTDLHTIDIARESPVALLGSDHPLAGEASVSMRTLRQEPAFSALCPPAGLDEIVDQVALGRLVTVVGSSVMDRLGQSVTAVPVSDLPATRVVLAWSRGVGNPAVSSFVAAARSVVAGYAPPRATG